MGNALNKIALSIALMLASVLAEAQVAHDRPIKQACAAFTSSGTALEVTVTEGEVSLALGHTPEAMQEFRLRLDALYEPASEGSASDGCRVFLDQQEDQAAVFVPFAISVADGKIIGQSVAFIRFDMVQQRWHTPVVVGPDKSSAGLYLKTSAVVGYYKKTRNLVVARSSGEVQLLDANDQAVSGSDTPGAVSSMTPGLWSGIDATNDRQWSGCPYREAFKRLAACALTSVTLLGTAREGLRIGPPPPGVAQWQGPRFFLFPSSSSLVFGGSPGRAFSRNLYLWVADLADGSIRGKGFAGRLHDDDLSGRAAISPDGAVVAFGVSMSRLAAPFLVDNYISSGERLVIVDTRSLRQIADVEPPNGRTPLAVAVDHRDHKTTLVVNWGDRWESRQLLDR